VKKEQYRGRILGLLAAILVLPALFWAAYVTLRVVSVGERDEHQHSDRDEVAQVLADDAEAHRTPPVSCSSAIALARAFSSPRS